MTVDFEALAHRAEVQASDAYDESDYESGSYYRGMKDAFTYAATEVVALRAKAAAADRVRALAEELDRQAPEQEAWDGNVDAAYTDIADRIRRALNGSDREDRGRC